MTYFDINVLYKFFPTVVDLQREAINARRSRPQLPGFKNKPRFGLIFKAGDIIRYFFEYGPASFFFEGLCLSLRNRRFGTKRTTILSRNVVKRVGIEMIIAYFLRRVYKLSFSDYKRKQFFYAKQRLYYIRRRINRESRVG